MNRKKDGHFDDDEGQEAVLHPKFGKKLTKNTHEETRQMIKKEVHHIVQDPFYQSSLIMKQHEIQQRMREQLMKEYGWNKLKPAGKQDSMEIN